MFIFPQLFPDSWQPCCRIMRLQLLPSANEVWGKVIFLHLFVILFTGGRGRVCLSACWDTTPRPGTPQTRHLPDQAPTPPDQALPCCKACWDTTCNACWDSTPPCCKACWDTTCNTCWDSNRPGAEHAGGTHPTGMQSC